MNYLMYLLIPLILSALLTPILKVVATRLEIYAVENERTLRKDCPYWRSCDLRIFYYLHGGVYENRYDD